MMQTKTIDLTFAIGILVLLLGSSLLFVKPQMQRMAHLQSQVRALRQQVGLSPQIHLGLNRTQAEVSAIEQRLSAFDRQLPRDVQLDTFLRQLDLAAKRTGFKVTLIKPGTLHDEELYSQLPLTITAESPFPAFYRFLSALYEMPRLTKIDTLTMARKSDSYVCDITLTLLIYVAKGIDES